MTHNSSLSRLTAVALVVGILVGLGVRAAFAANAESSWQVTGTVAGYTYENRSFISNTGTDAATDDQTTNLVNVPSGYMGVWAGLYESNGSLCKQSAWYYNSGPAAGIGYPTNGTYCGTGNYYSYGESKAYTGSGYVAYHTYTSPELGFP